MKEMIINGVDVSGCEDYSALEHLKTNNGFDEHPDFCCNYIDHICVNHPNCYYKRLKRLEQKNAELKADLKSLEYTVALRGKRDIDNAADLFAKHIAKIESENSILKAENAELKENGCEQCKHLDLYIKYKQTLQEIKECLKDWEKAYMSFGFCEYDNILEKIKAIITKAEVGK